MKAKLFISGEAKEIRLFDGRQVFANDGESTEDFTARVTKAVKEDDLEDLDLSEITVDSLAKVKTDALMKAYDKENYGSVYAEVIKTVLKARKVTVKAKTAPKKTEAVDTSKAEAAKQAKADDAAKIKAAKEAEKTAAKEAKDKAKADKAEARAAAKAEKEANKVVREKFAGHTIEELAEAKANVGHKATFNPFPIEGRAEIVEGVIRGVVTDKRVDRTYYRAYDEAKKLYYVSINNKTLTIGELAPNDRAEKEAAKVAAKAEKTEAAAKAKADKDAAKQVKADEAAKAKAEKTEAAAAKKAEADAAKAKAVVPAAEPAAPAKGKGFSRTGKIAISE